MEVHAAPGHQVRERPAGHGSRTSSSASSGRSTGRRSPAAPNYSNQYFLHGDTYQGPYTSPGAYDGVTVDGKTITIQHGASRSRTCRTGAAFPAMGPIPPGKASDPATYKNHPWATGPYMFKPAATRPASR